MKHKITCFDRQDEQRRIVAYLDGLQAKVKSLPARFSGRLQSARVRRTMLNEMNLLDEIMPLNQSALSGRCDALTLAAAKRAACVSPLRANGRKQR